jgi:hypothetical protein
LSSAECCQPRYTKFGTTPVNVLLAFSVDGK